MTTKVAAALLAATVLPVGIIIPYGGTTEPTGWLFCYGQTVSRTTYADLFAAFGTTYNTGGEAGTDFRLPDMRGRVVAGQDDMGGSSANRLTGTSGGVNGDNLGATGGAETHTLTSGELANHTHAQTANDQASQQQNTVSGPSAGVGYATAAGAGSGIITGGVTGGSGSAHNNVQPTIILNYIVKAL